MRSRTLFVVLAFSTGFIMNAAAQQSNSAVLLGLPAGQNCPVALTANRLREGGMARVTSRNEPQGPALHLTFRPTTDPRGIAAADLILHGTLGDRIVPTATRNTADATETASVSASDGGNFTFNSVVILRKLTAVDFVELRSITFADGTRWHASSTSTCRVVPSNLRLVAGTR